MDPRRAAVRRRRALVASMALLAGLVVHNVVLAARNQRDLPPAERPHVSPRDIEKVASENRHAQVRGRYAHLYYLAQRIKGSSLLVPPAFAELTWELERVAGQRVTVSPTPLVIDPAAVKRLRQRTPVKRLWYVRRINGRRRYQTLWLRLDKSAGEHVLAETTSGRELFIIPRTSYDRVAAPPGVEPGRL